MAHTEHWQETLVSSSLLCSPPFIQPSSSPPSASGMSPAQDTAPGTKTQFLPLVGTAVRYGHSYGSALSRGGWGTPGGGCGSAEWGGGLSWRRGGPQGDLHKAKTSIRRPWWTPAKEDRHDLRALGSPKAGSRVCSPGPGRHTQGLHEARWEKHDA